MIEFPITLTSGGSVCLPGHTYALALGYTKNRSVYRLHVDATGEWAGLAIRAFWHIPGGADPPASLVVDGYVDVPASVTAQPGSGCILAGQDVRPSGQRPVERRRRCRGGSPCAGVLRRSGR